MQSSLVPPRLAARLREATRELHARVERAGIAPQLLRGALPRADYVALLHNLHALYAALEASLARRAEHACIAPLPLAALRRRERLARDLEALGARVEEPPALQPATQRYVQRLRALEADDPARLVAHAYVRYLGDLNGGQALSRMVARGLALEPGRGTAFYDFGPAPGALARRLRGALDALPVDEATAEGIVEEARSAFRRHVELFEQLDASRSRG